MAWKVLLACCALVLLMTTVTSELVLVYSIQRHGARNVLPKSAVLTESDAFGGPTLLPAGQRMCYSAGTAFHSRYISQASCARSQPATCLSLPGREQYGVLNSPGIGFHNYNSFANSSGLDRTIMSANSFLAGVFPATAGGANSSSSLQVVPVYSVADSEDWRIRSYAKCPAYQRRLAAWLSSDAFKQKEQDSQALRERVQALAPQLNTSLAMWWDVYDAFNVWRAYGVGTPMPSIDNATFTQVVDLAMWLETSKMSPELTGNLLGGGLLGDLLARLAAAEDAVASGSQAPYYKLLVVSSHYNTQLGLLAALQAAVPPSRRTQYAWQHKIAPLASVLVFELHTVPNGGFAVRAVYQDGPDAPYRPLPLPCAASGDAADVLLGPGSCSLEAFRALAGPQALNSSAGWCEACSNSKVMACVVRNMERQLMAVGVDPAAVKAGDRSGGAAAYPSNGARPGQSSPWVYVAVVLAAALLLTLAAGTIVLVRHRRRQRLQQKQQLDGHGGVLPAQSGASLL